MKRIARIQQRKRQTWLDLPSSGIEEIDHGQNGIGAVGQGCAEASSIRREGIASQGQAGNRAGHGADLHQRQDEDHYLGSADRHHEDGLDGRRRVGRVFERSAPRDRDYLKRGAGSSYSNLE